MKRYLETGNFAIAEGATMAGCRLFVGYPITPATEIAEAMSKIMPKIGGYYLQAEDECAAFHMCIGGAIGGYKAMTATSGPGFILYADPYGWAIGSEIPVVVLNSGRVGPVSGITGSPGQGEFYNVRYPTQGGNYETIVLAPNSAQEAFQLTVEAFYLSERFRTPVTILADQLVTDGMEDISIPETEKEKKAMGLRFAERGIHKGPVFYPATDEIDIPPVVLGRNTNALCSDWTPTEEGYDTEVVEQCHQHVYRLIYKIRNHKDLITRYDPLFMDDVAVDFPDLTLLMVHSGRGFWYDRAYFLAKLHANMYMEIAGLPPQKLLDYFPELERVADKVVFGSDWPGMPHIKRNVEIIRGLPLSEETKEKILGGNAARILGIG